MSTARGGWVEESTSLEQDSTRPEPEPSKKKKKKKKKKTEQEDGDDDDAVATIDLEEEADGTAVEDIADGDGAAAGEGAAGAVGSEDTPPQKTHAALAAEVTKLGAILQELSDCALRHDEVAALRRGDDEVVVADENDLDGDGEPDVLTREQQKVWLSWAKERAQEYADKVHPRQVHETGSVTKLPLRCRPNELLVAMGGIVPSLYLEFLKFMFGYSLLGVLFSVPSYVLSSVYADQVYTDGVLSSYPTMTLYLSIGAREQCATSQCETTNLVAMIFEAIYSLLLLRGMFRFRGRVRELNAVNEANNIFTSEYAVQLHGMPAHVNPEQVKEHLERVLAESGGLAAHQCRVWDVALMTNCSEVLRNAVKQAPLERQFTVLSKKLRTMEAFRAEKDTGWDINQKIGALEDRCNEATERLVAARARIERRGFESTTEVVGAFVTFEEQPARDACLALYQGGVKWLNQPKRQRFLSADPKRPSKERMHRLRAFPPPQPRDVQHANLPYRVLALNCRGLGTALRRLISKGLLVLFILVSFGVIIAVNAPKTNSDALATVMAELNIDAETAVLVVDTVFPFVASIVVVVVNKAIELLVGLLGSFERHPTLSAMHKSKASTLFIAQAFNTGLVSLVLLAAPPPALYADYMDQCQCGGLFCCAIGPNGVLLRGAHLTMTSGWHKDVGTLVVSSMIIQALLVWVGPWPLMLIAYLKRRFLAASAGHRLDMEKLWTGPRIDLPKFVGKAYAFSFVMLAYSAPLPILYIAGLFFFGGLWLCERYAFLRIHRTPPPYSYVLFNDTLWWMPWAVAAHLGFGFWGYASLPSPKVRSGPWVRPYNNLTLDSAILSATQATNTTTLSSTLGAGLTGVAGGNADVAAALGALGSFYDLPGHVNSLGTIVLFALTVILVVVLLLLVLRASPLYVPLQPLEDAITRGLSTAATKLCAKCLRRTTRVAPHADGADGADGSGGGDGITHSGKIVDPPFPKVLEGVQRPTVRTCNGQVVHAHQVGGRRTRLGSVSRWTPTALMFRCLGMPDDAPRVSEAEWVDAKPLFSQLTVPADISYQPEFHPDYDQAFVMLLEPGRLKALAGAKPKEKAEP